MNEKQKLLIDLVSDTVLNLTVYDRKEDEDLSIKDVEENLTPEVIKEMVKAFEEELMKHAN